jgi:hypothetical protein
MHARWSDHKVAYVYYQSITPQTSYGHRIMVAQTTLCYLPLPIYDSYKNKISLSILLDIQDVHLFLLTYKASTPTIHYQPQYLFLLKCKSPPQQSTIICHYRFLLTCKISFILKFTSTKIMICTSTRYIINYGYNISSIMLIKKLYIYACGVVVLIKWMS